MAYEQGLQALTSYNYKYWIQESSAYFPRLLYRCISRFDTFICRWTSTFKFELFNAIWLNFVCLYLPLVQ